MVFVIYLVLSKNIPTRVILLNGKVKSSPFCSKYLVILPRLPVF